MKRTRDRPAGSRDGIVGLGRPPEGAVMHGMNGREFLTVGAGSAAAPAFGRPPHGTPGLLRAGSRRSRRSLWFQRKSGWERPRSTWRMTKAARPDVPPVVLLHGFPYDPRAFRGRSDPMRPAFGPSCLTCGAMAARGSFLRTGCDRASRPPWRTTSSSCSEPWSHERRLLENVGHNPPQEVPRAFAEAVLDLCQG